MPKSRREFLACSALGVLGAALPLDAAQTPGSPINQQTPGAPTAFGTSAPVGPEVSATTFKEAQKLVQVEMTPSDLAQAAGNWRMQMAPLYERRTGPRKMTLEPNLSPATQWNPSLPGIVTGKKPSAQSAVLIRSADKKVTLRATE